jgi:hypothetical protein
VSVITPIHGLTHTVTLVLPINLTDQRVGGVLMAPTHQVPCGLEVTPSCILNLIVAPVAKVTLLISIETLFNI